MKTFCITILLMLGLALSAQNTIEVSEKATLQSDMNIEYMLEKYIEKNEKADEIDGYRVQVMYSSNREEVYAKKTEVYQAFRSCQSYLVYDQPYYKLRMGDFKTKIEARKFLEKVIATYPTAFIVQDRIKL